MDLTGVLIEQVFRFDNTAAKQPDDKGSGSSKRVKNMNTFVADATAEPLLHHIFDRLDDKVHNFNRGINDTQSLGFFRKRIFEELFIQFDDDLLLSFGIINAFCTLLHTGIELVQRFLLFFQCIVIQHI